MTWWRVLLRLWGLREVPAVPRTGAPTVIVALGCAWLGAWVSIDRWQRQPEPHFVAAGLPLLAWYVLGIAGLGLILHWRSQPRPDLKAMLVLALGVVPLPLLTAGVLVYWLPPGWVWWAWAVVAVYVTCYLTRSLHALTGGRQRMAVVAGVLFVAAFVCASDALDVIPDVWSPLTGPADDDAALAVREALLFEQADRIDAALESVERDPAAGSQAFFLGFAGVGEQKVFAEEIALASGVVAARFEVGDRRLALVNDARDPDGAPIASVSGLYYALQGLADRMELDDDVLFLAISSHGSAEPSIAVSNAQLPFASLTAAQLKDALDASGIEWRVIVISACFAGGFIEDLRDPKTIVIAAAAADKTSFGCSSDSDLTYFGQAFYRDALPTAVSLRAAFEAAKSAVAAREHREQFTPSEPQAFFGADIERKLEELGKRRSLETRNRRAAAHREAAA